MTCDAPWAIADEMALLPSSRDAMRAQPRAAATETIRVRRADLNRNFENLDRDLWRDRRPLNYAQGVAVFLAALGKLKWTVAAPSSVPEPDPKPCTHPSDA